MLAASVNGAFGKAGLLLVLIAATFGALSTVYWIRRHDAKTLRQAPMYTWLCISGVLLAAFPMKRKGRPTDATSAPIPPAEIVVEPEGQAISV